MKTKFLRTRKAFVSILLLCALFLPVATSSVRVRAEVALDKISTETLNASGSAYKKAFDYWNNATTSYTEKGFEVNVPASADEKSICSVNELSVTKADPLRLKINLPVYQDDAFNENSTKTFVDDAVKRHALNVTLYADSSAKVPLVRLTVWGNSTSKTDPEGRGYTSANLIVYDGSGWTKKAEIGNIRLIGTATESGEYDLTFDNEDFFQSWVWNNQEGDNARYAKQTVSAWGWGANNPTEVEKALRETFSGRTHIKEMVISMNNNEGTAGKFYVTQINEQSLKVQNGGIVFTDWISFTGAKVVNGATFVTGEDYRFEITNNLENYEAGTASSADVSVLGKVYPGSDNLYGNIGWNASGENSGIFIDVIAPDGSKESFETKDSWNNVPFSFKKIGENTVNICVLTKLGFAASKTLKVNVGMGEADLQTRDGASIRLTESAGIRFSAKILKSDYEKLVNVYGAENVSLGMRVERENAYADVVAVNTREEDGYILFNAVITGIPESRYDTEYSAKAWVEIRFNGKTERIYKESENGNRRSIADVAQTLLELGTYAGTEYENLLKVFTGGQQ